MFLSVASLSLCAISTVRASEREAFHRALEQVQILHSVAPFCHYKDVQADQRPKCAFAGFCFGSAVQSTDQ